MSVMKVHILRCGTVHLATGRSPFATRVTLPVWCYLVEHPTQGLLLVDTGLGTQPLGPFLTWYYRCEPGPSITKQLNKRGIAPDELDAVILSDLDIDHTGGIHEVRAAKRFLVSEEEYFWTPRTVFAAYQPRSLWENDVIVMMGIAASAFCAVFIWFTWLAFVFVLHISIHCAILWVQG